MNYMDEHNILLLASFYFVLIFQYPRNGKLYPIEIKKTATPDVRLIRVFNVIDKSPLQRGTGAILCTAEKLSAFDKDNLIVPIWMI